MPAATHSTDPPSWACAQERERQEHLRRLSLSADASESAVLITDRNMRIVYVNQGFHQMFGWHIDEAQGQLAITLLAPQRGADAVSQDLARLAAGRAIQFEDLITGKQHQRYWARVICTPITGPDALWQYTVTTATDITRARLHETLQHRALEAMAREQPLTRVLEIICEEVERIAPDITASILEIDPQGRLHTLAAPSLPADYCQAIEGLSIGPSTGTCGTAAWRNDTVQAADIAQDPLWAAYRHLILPLGYQASWSTPIRNGQGDVIATFAFYFRHTLHPASEQFHQRLVDACTHLCSLALTREHTRQRLRQLAFYDSLTGMPNRSLLHAKADQALATSNRQQASLAVLFVDLDRFKPVNDSLGHPAGDDVLRQVATRLLGALRPTDMAGRLSGDEFAVILPNCDTEYATRTAERIQSALAEPLYIAGTELTISACIGIALSPADGRDIDTLLQRADLAMDQAKRDGRGRFRFFSNEMNQLAQEHLMLENALRDALRHRALHLHYQPQVETCTGRLYGVEALSRWWHPQRGNIPPTQFIPLAEECGLIIELGYWVLDEACRQLAAWRAEGLCVPAVSINLSPSSFHRLDLPHHIVAALGRHALSPQDLTIELTESVLLDTHPSTLQTISAVHALGVRLSMDDFGTGYASLNYLRRLPITELKLDRGFVADLAHDEAARAISGAVVGIGKNLHLTVIAEGVETPTQLDLLRSLGYPVAQGYLLSRPLAPDQLGLWLRDNAPAPHDATRPIT